MSLFQTIRVALRALLRNKMRSFLTTLGIIIGVAAVIAMVAIGEGAKKTVEEAFASMGSNLLVIMPGSTSSGGSRGGFGSGSTLTWEDLKAIQTECPSVIMAAPSLRSSAQVMSEDQNWTTQVTGTTPEYFDIRSWKAAQGSVLTTSDVESGAKVVVLGQTVVDKLFGPGADPIGHSIRIKNIPFSIVGVTARKGQSPGGQDYDDAAFIPVTTFNSKVQGGLKNYLNGIIFVGSSSPAATARAEKEVANLLRDRHQLQPGTEDDFSIRNLTEMASASQEGTKTMTSLLMWVAVVSLAVGGIGIMNIMLVSVTERTREIGLRMAVGAKPMHILFQFLIEALALSTIGGLVGVGGGVFGAMRVAEALKWPMLVRVDVIVVAVVFSALVGVIFGLYPAYKASKLDPIEALRYE
jgi:putative ABC transport system permease protein